MSGWEGGRGSKVKRCFESFESIWKEKNQCIRQKTGVQNIVQEIKQYQEKWLQHVQRMDTDYQNKHYNINQKD